MAEKELSIGRIVDLIPDGVGNLDVCVWFDRARVVPITISERILKARDISVSLGNLLIARINADAVEELFVDPTDISEINQERNI